MRATAETLMGPSAESFYLVFRGKVSLEKRGQLGRTVTTRRTTIEVVGSGQPIGWSSPVERYQYASGGVCREATGLRRTEG